MEAVGVQVRCQKSRDGLELARRELFARWRMLQTMFHCARCIVRRCRPVGRTVRHCHRSVTSPHDALLFVLVQHGILYQLSIAAAKLAGLPGILLRCTLAVHRRYFT